MEKKLVFYYYVIDSPINDLHFLCLERYANIFDSALFYISVDDFSMHEKINAIEQNIIEIFPCKDIQFKICPNTAFREVYTFDKMLKEKKDCFIFFGHNKGTTNFFDEKIDKYCLYRWVAGMYYFSLEFEKEAQTFFEKGGVMYGSFGDGDSYIGTFFWLNKKALKEYNIDYPDNYDRFCAETFCHYIPDILLNFHQNKTGYKDYYNDFETALSDRYPEHEDFNRFYDEIIDELSKRGAYIPS